MALRLSLNESGAITIFIGFPFQSLGWLQVTAAADNLGYNCGSAHSVVSLTYLLIASDASTKAP
jgi:hypothetical protein